MNTEKVISMILIQFRTMLFGLILLFLEIASSKAEVNKEEILQRLKFHWGVIQSVELKGEEYVCDENWSRKPNTPYFQFEFAMGGGGKREFKNILLDAKGNKSNIIWYRDDGKLLCTLQTFKNYIDVVDTVTITKSTNTPDSFNTSMNAYLWQWLPRGHRMADVVDSDSKLSKKKDAKWGDLVLVETELDGYPIKLELSEKYDYLPVRISFNNMSDQEVEKFENVKGVWLPTKGHILAKSPDGTRIHRGFIANGITINEFIPQARFMMPKLETGSLMINRTAKGTSGIFSHVKATEVQLYEFRNSLESKYNAKIDDDSIQPVIVSREPERNAWPNRLLVLSTFLLVLVVVHRVRAFRIQIRS